MVKGKGFRFEIVAAFMFVFLLVAGSMAWSAEGFIKEIKSPLFSQPEFAMPGGEVPVVLAAPADGKVIHAEALPVQGSGGKAGFRGAEGVALKSGENRFMLKVPATADPGMFDLCVTYETSAGSGKNCQPHSVVVVASFDVPFRVVQITDYHMGDPRAGQMFPGIDIAKVRRTAFARAHEEKPNFIIVTGDITAYPQTYDHDYPYSVQEILENAKEPIITIPGNHDLYAYSDNDGKIIWDGADYWPRYYGPFHRTLDYGDYRFILFNSYRYPQDARNQNREWHLKAGSTLTFQGAIDKEEFNWLKEQMDGAGAKPIILAAHHGPKAFDMVPAQWCKSCMMPKKFMAFIAKYNVPYYFCGHTHSNDETLEKGTNYITTSATGSDVDKEDLWGIRVIDFHADKTISQRYIKLFETPPVK